MNIVRFAEAQRYEPEKDWKRLSLCNEADISIEHFVKPARHASPHHEHPNAQVLVVLEGQIEVRTDDGQRAVLGEGDSVYIPGGEPHVVTNLLDKPSVGLDIFIPGRSFDFWLQRKRGGASA